MHRLARGAGATALTTHLCRTARVASSRYPLKELLGSECNLCFQRVCSPVLLTADDLHCRATREGDLDCPRVTLSFPPSTQPWYNALPMKRKAFERLVAQALDELPPEVQEQLDNVDVVVEEWPDPATLRRAGVRHAVQLLGFYHGVPRTKRTHNYGLVLPDKISIYRRPIELRSRTAEEMRATVRRVVRHEIAHHFGISDDRLREIGAY